MKEETAIDSKLLDSSVIFAYLIEGSFKVIVEKEEVLYISALTIFEIKKKLLKSKIPENVILDKISYLKKRFIVLDLNAEISEFASSLSFKYNLPAIDSLIYAASLINKSKLITLDNDFRGLKNVEIIGQ